MENKEQKHHHHILPNRTAFAVGAALLVLTWVTVWIAGVNLGKFNFLVAMVVATIKASLVALIFMNLWYDKKENGVIFAASFLFLAIFIVLTATDLFFRGDVYVKGPLTVAVQAKSKLVKPWISTPELVAHGKELFQVQCVSCHGAAGHGDGPAAAALNPKPRNFAAEAGWKNGRKPSQVFKTLKEGIQGGAMASFATLPADDRWALAHYVVSLGPTQPQDTPEDLAKIGMDPNSKGGPAEDVTIPVDVAMKLMEEPEPKLVAADPSVQRSADMSAGARLYRAQCLSCHGEGGEGAIKNGKMGGVPKAMVAARPWAASLESLQSQEKFNQVVIRGIPGGLMPGYGQLSGGELKDLYQYVRSLASGR